MKTQAAAAKAGVTPRTIQTWCRRNVIAATKVCGRWDIDEASLAYRISLTAKPASSTAITIDAGRFVVIGRETVLEQAFLTQQPVRITDGVCAGDVVYLGDQGTTYGDYGITLETTSLIRSYADGTATYLVTPHRRAEAPKLSAIEDEMEEEALQAEIRAAQADREYLNSDY